ncbi:MAG: hybrid sensor histidine kinase/response regulator [Promethearchaeota archaeon]
MKMFQDVGVQTFVNALKEGIISSDSEGIINYINESASNLIGIPKKSIEKQNIYKILKLFDKETNLQIRDFIEKVKFTHKQYQFNHQLYLRNALNEELHVISKIIPLYEDDTHFKGILIILHDISELEEYKKQFQTTLRMNSLGKLSRGIAHDFNNVLTGILGNISLVKMDFHQGEEAFELLSDAESEIDRARIMTQQLLTFSKDSNAKKEEIDFDRELRELVDFTLSGSNVTCSYKIENDLWKVMADKAQISQVIHNITINAVRSMPIGGNIEISARNLIITPNNELNLTPGDYIEFIIADHGIGIEHEKLEHIFDPFFETSIGEKGMGLTVVQDIIKYHNGYVKIESELDVGTSVFIYIPAIRSKKEEISTEKKIHPHQGARLLIMDDEEIIRRVLGKMCAQIGFETEMAENGEKAISMYEIAKKNGNPYELVILDLTVKGGMGGKQAAEKIKELNPNVKIIASSGYATDNMIIEFEKYGFAGVLVKPYKIDKLKNTINRILDIE